MSMVSYAIKMIALDGRDDLPSSTRLSMHHEGDDFQFASPDTLKKS